MNSRERVNCAIWFGRPDRFPVSHAVLPSAQLKYGQALNEMLAEYREDFGWDFMTDRPLEHFPALYREGRHRDAFGTVWQVEWAGICGIPAECPIADLDRYAEYRRPEDFTAGPPSARPYSGHMCGFDDRWYARGAWITYFEQLPQMRGMENFLMDLASGPCELERLMDDLLAFNLRWLDKWIKLECDGLHFADDWGDQRRLLIKPDLCAGMVAVVIPIYLAESVPAEIRGRGATAFQWFITLGLAGAMGAGAWYQTGAKRTVLAAAGDAAGTLAAQDHAWRQMFLTSAYPSLVFLLGMVFVHESPRWLFRHGRKQQAQAVLQRTRPSEQAALELREMDELANEGACSGRTGSEDSVFQRRYVVPFLLAVALLGINQATGIVAVFTFPVVMLHQAGLSAGIAAKISLALGLLNPVATLVGIALYFGLAAFRLPETKGKTLEAIELQFVRGDGESE